MMTKEKSRNLRVGIFVAAALGVLAAAVFVIGQERSMFTTKTRIYTSFADINGLVVGAPVRLAGVDVGRVTGISFAPDLASGEARVELSIETEYMPRVRADSRAYIDSKGLLGDKLINLSVGSPKARVLKEGDVVQPRPGLSLEAMAQQVERTASSVGHAADTAAASLDRVMTPELAENLQRITGSLATLLEQAQNGDSVAHRLFYDAQAAQHLSDTLANLDRASANAGTASARIDRVLARVEQGPGTLHELAYGSGGAELASEWQRAGTEIADVAARLNRGEGMAGALLTSPQGKQLVDDFAALAARLNRISSDVERGRGTVGGLLVDPSVYEDMKTVLGNIERNVIFKALVRMTIKEDGLRRPARIAQPAAP